MPVGSPRASLEYAIQDCGACLPAFLPTYLLHTPTSHQQPYLLQPSLCLIHHYPRPSRHFISIFTSLHSHPQINLTPPPTTITPTYSFIHFAQLHHHALPIPNQAHAASSYAILAMAHNAIPHTHSSSHMQAKTLPICPPPPHTTHPPISTSAILCQ